MPTTTKNGKKPSQAFLKKMAKFKLQYETGIQGQIDVCREFERAYSLKRKDLERHLRDIKKKPAYP